MKYHTLFFSKIKKDVTKFVLCCSHDLRFKGLNYQYNLTFAALYWILRNKDQVMITQFNIDKVFVRKIMNIFLSISLDIRFGCSKEPSH